MTDTLLIWKTFEEKGFFYMMRQKLKEREPKQTQYPTLEVIPIETLIQHLREEWNELDEALKTRGVIDVQEECCDMANILAMIFSNLQLKGVKT